MGGDERHSPDAKARPGPSERAPASHWERQRLTGLNRDDTNPASVEEHVGALMEIYRNPRIPLRLVSPLSWVAARVGSQAALVGSAASVGAEVAVLPNGDLYAGEGVVGLERWRLGNVLEDAANIRWERLDVMAEAFSNAMQPDECKRCDWRYRCGGVDARVMLSAERDGVSNGQAGRFEFYCAPRKRLSRKSMSRKSIAQGVPCGSHLRKMLVAKQRKRTHTAMKL